MRGGRLAGRHHLVGIEVAQLVEAEGAARGDLQRLGEQRRRVGLRQPQPRAQVALGVRVQRQPAGVERAAEADGGEHVVQGLAGPDMHLHVAGGDQRHAGLGAGPAQPVQPHRVVEQAQQRDGEPAAAGVGVAQPARQVAQGGVGGAARRRGEQQAVVQLGGAQPAGAQPVAALGRGAPQPGDEAAQPPVAGQVAGQRDEGEAAGHAAVAPALALRRLDGELAADDQRQAVLLRRDVRPHDAGQAAFVGQGERRVAEGARPRDQFLGMAGTAQEAEVAQAVQLGVVGEHGTVGRLREQRSKAAEAVWAGGGIGRCAAARLQAKQPCRNQAVPSSPSARRAWNTHSTPACSLSATQ